MVAEAVLIGSDVLGSPDRDLGRVLMGNFVRLLGEREQLPKYVVLWNAGAKLAVEGSDDLGYMKRLEERGVKVVSCRTCLEYFGLEDKVAIGEVVGMVQIQDILTTHHVLTV